MAVQTELNHLQRTRPINLGVSMQAGAGAGAVAPTDWLAGPTDVIWVQTENATAPAQICTRQHTKQHSSIVPIVCHLLIPSLQ